MSRTDPIPGFAADPYRLTRLESGLTVITESLPYVRSVAFGVWSRAGSRDEEPEREGVAHFLEHMFFKGTGTRSAFDIAYELERLGGYLNAFTSKDHTCYYAHLLDTHLAVAVDVLGDMIQHARFDPEETEREKQVVLEEIKTSFDTPDDWVHELFFADLFGAHPLAHPVLGGSETVAALTPADLRAFVADRYRPDTVLLAAAGSLEHERVVELVAGTFTDLPVEPAAGRQVVAADGRGRVFSHPRDISQVHAITGAHALAYGHDDRYALVILMNILAGGMSSRLFQKVREQRGLVYTISGLTTFFEETGMAAFYFAAAPENLPLALELVAEELAAVARTGEIAAEELASAREQVKGHLMLGLESTFNRMSRLAKGIMFEGRIIPLDETIARLEAVTGEDLARLAGDIFTEGAMTTTLLGALPDGVGTLR